MKLILNKTETVHKVTTSPKIYANTNLQILKWQIEPSTRKVYMYISMNHRIATNTTGSYFVKRVLRSIIFILYAWNVRLQHQRKSLES